MNHGMLEGVIQATETQFQILRSADGNPTPEIIKNFKGMLFMLGYDIGSLIAYDAKNGPHEIGARQVKFVHQFDSLVLYHPVDGLWAPDSVLKGIKLAAPESTLADKLVVGHHQLPISRGLRLFVKKKGEQFEYNSGVYEIIGYNPDADGSPAVVHFLSGNKSPHHERMYFGPNNNALCLPGNIVARIIDAERLAQYEANNINSTISRAR